MFARPITRSFRSIPSRRLLSTAPSASASSSFSRNAVIGLTTLTIAALAVTSEQRRVWNDDRVRESVLDQGSLKKNVHKRDGAADASSSSSNTDTIKKAAAEKVGQVKEKAVEKTQEVKDEVTKATPSSSSSSTTPSDDSTAAHVVEEKSAEAAQPSQGAFNEETGEINWDCPCLGGMADGPCGEEFKAAFSCFIYSEAEPKGVDCVEKFKHMQDCFRAHPEIYGEEIDDDEEPSSDVPNPADEGVTIKEDIKVPS
ncbi:hypothetical protein V865_000447 [Kwoniella europaea PYCC6329]|uniref:Mitochondrial intermembrane space import and assembly protein 40 n=1 Tax=Kwoniella europaea PYCC6329 TaxID=1423913 RepID=A0AAX4KA78_9TREE